MGSYLSAGILALGLLAVLTVVGIAERLVRPPACPSVRCAATRTAPWAPGAP